MKRPPKQFTALAIDQLKAESVRYEWPNSLVPGLYVHVTDKGAKSWVVRGRVNGERFKVTLGTTAAVPVDQARELARAALTAKVAGQNPQTLKKEKAAEIAEAARMVETVSMNWDEYEYFQLSQIGTDTAAKYRGVATRLMLPAWGKRQLTEISRRDVISLIDGAVATRGPAAGNNAHAAISAFLNWAVPRDETSHGQSI